MGGVLSVTKSVPSAANETVIPELTLVLIGDANSIEIGSKNILIDHDEQTNVEQFSTKLYDLCGRHISVINMLGLQNIDKFPLNQEIHAFLLLVPHGLHSSHYSSGVQWLEKAFGKELLAYVMTVVTHESDEKCEGALTDLNANSSFVEKRYHTCTKSMKDEREIIALLEKIDIMVSENGHHGYSGVMCAENRGKKEHLDHKSPKEERINTSVFQQNQTTAVEDMEVDTAEIKQDSQKTDDSTGGKSEIKSVSSATKKKGNLDMDTSGNMDKSLEISEEINRNKQYQREAETLLGRLHLQDKQQQKLSPADFLIHLGQCDPVNEPDDVEHSKNDDNKGGESEIKPVQSATTEKGTLDMDTSGNKDKCDPVNGPGDDEHSKNDDNKGGESEITSVSSANNEKGDELEESAAETEVKCGPVNSDEHSDKDDDSTRVGGESEIESVSSSATNEKGEADGVKELSNESSSNMSERSMEEIDAEKDTTSSSQTVSPVTKERDELEESSAETEVKCDPVNGPGDDEHSKNDDNTGGQSEITSVSSANNEKGDELEESAAETEVKCGPVNSAEHSDKDDDSTRVGGESEIKSVLSSATNEKGEADGVKELSNESSSNMSERSMEESDAEKDTSSSSQTVSTVTKERDELEESAAETEVKCDPVNEAGDVEHSKNDDNTTIGGESEIKPVQSATTEKGEADGVKELSNESSSNMSERSMEESDAEKDTTSSSQTVSTVTKEPDELEESAAETEVNCGPVNSAEHSDRDDDSTRVGGESEIKSVLSSATNEKGEADGVKELSNESSSNMSERSMEESDAEKDTSSSSQTVSTVTKERDELEESAAETEVNCDPVNELGDVEHSKNDDNATIGGESEIKPVQSATTEKGTLDMDTSGNKDKCDPVNGPGDDEHSKNDDNTGGESEITSVSSANNENGDKLEESAAETEVKCGPVNSDEHSDKDDDSTRVGGEFEIKSVLSSATNEKGEADGVKELSNESSSNMSERSMEESDAEKDTSSSSQTVSTVTKERDELEESAAETEIKCDPVNEPDDVAHSKNDDNTTIGGESEIKPVQSATTEKGTLDMDTRGNKDKQSVEISEEINRKKQYQREAKTLLGRLHLQDKQQQKLSPADFLKCDAVNGPGDDEHSKNDDNTGGESEITSVSSANNEKGDELEESAAETECGPVNSAEHSDKDDDSKRVGGESEIKSVLTSATNEKGEADGVKELSNESSSNMSERSMEESDAEKDTSSSSQTVSTVTKERDELEKSAAETEVKCDPVNELGDVEHSKNDDNTTIGGESEIKPVQSATTEKGALDTSGNKDKCEPVRGPGDDEHSKNDDNTGGESEIPSVSSANNEKGDELEESSAKTEVKCGPVNSAEHSDKDEDSTRVGGESEIKSVLSSATNEKGEADGVKELSNESSSNMSERSMEESDAEKDTSSSSQTVSTVTKERDELEESAAETEVKCDPVNELGDVEHSKNDDNTTIGGESEIKPVQSATTEKGTLDTSGNKDKQSAEISEEINRKKQYQREAETLLGRLHLQDKHQQKLSPADFLKVGPPVKQDHDTSEKDLALTFLQRLMMLDYRARYIPVKQDSPEEFDTVDTDDGDLDDFYSTSVNFDQSELKTHVHPMDVQMAVFHCSDSFFKQNMITKLSQCQYALPLLVPDPVTMDIGCPLWTFRQIRKTWKITENKDNSNIVTMKSMPICKAETPMVSFFRLGSLSLSKSQLMNSLINDRHNTFFHRNCPGSTKSRHLMDGVAEIAWYCPAGKPNDAFTDCIAFCNLHGDALSIEKQRNILIDKSSVNVVLVPTLEKDAKSTAVISALYKSQKPLIILIADNDCGAVKKKKGKYKGGLKDRSHSDVSEELKKIIGNILSGPHASFQLETLTVVSGIRVDEDDEACQKGRSAAMKVVNLLQGMDVSKIKDTFLPCQGQLWHEWCKINKEQYHLKGNIEKEKCEKQQKLNQIRQKQHTASCSEPMKLFIESLSSLPSTDKVYFLKWTQVLIDALSTDDLSSILQNYDEKWTEVLALKKKHDKSDLLKGKQTELDDISTKLQSATFGLEHIFREMGQIYEAHASLQKQTKRVQTDWSKYPELAAELMISGHPMELMDGDAGHVPLTWISSLLDEVIKKLGDKRVFVLSVLGVQSSGKSTMLNAMFGLQFAVSAGRCTKGAFMQLVKVSEEIKEDFKFDYILVVDTEGLRALELEGNATLQHDNELATFVVGLGNMTLINIFGENPAEMQDVLQIVVQAFMRMKKIKLSPSCVFVHQNVTDIAAAEKNMDGKRRLQEKLDQMASLAAKEEDCDAECFSDVIAFDVQKDVKYFAQLWEGSPPMAPPNPGYSESVQELKTIILSKASLSAGITLSQFKSKIQDLWKALLNERFVFSFKNTLEIAVYRKLEVQYGNWTWALRSNMLTIEIGLHTQIENGKLDKVELSYLYKEMNKTYGEITKAMTTYFDDDRDKEMLVQWRGRFESKIKEFHDEQVRAVKKRLDEVIQQKNACKKLDDKKTEFENTLLQKSKELAHRLKDKAKDEEELKKHFNSVWSGLVHELTADTKPIEDINYEEDQSTILQELGVEWCLINESKSSGSYKKISEVGDYSYYVSLTKHQDVFDTSQQSKNDKRENTNTKGKGSYSLSKAWVFFTTKLGFGSTQQIEKHTSRSLLSHEEQKLIRSLIDDVELQTRKIIQKKPVTTRGYRSTYLQEVANHVKEKVTEFESERKYALKKEFTVDLILYVFHRAGRWLSESHKKFKGNNDALTYVESKKMQYYNIFSSFCKGNSSAVVLGELICEKLKSSSVEAVCNKTAIDLAGEMRCSFPAFSGNRLNLEKHVLKLLAEKEDFNGFITYIQHPRRQVETFIKDEVQKYIFKDNKNKAQNILKKNVEDIKNLVSQALFDATEKVKTQRGDLDMWMEEFSSLLNDTLTFNTICCENFSDINSFDFLKEEIEKGLECVIMEVSSLSLDKMKEFRMKSDQILIDQLCNCCWVTCPFCAAVCINTLEDHSPDKHNVPFHRPAGIMGWHTRGTVELDIDFCTTSVASAGSFYPHSDSDKSIPYKLYQTAGEKYATWEITPDASKLTYWKWFVCRFQKQLEDHYELKFQGRGEIPREWRDHSKQEAIDSLDEMYNL
ncbi:interferon-induced very large GTPase 1-like isoform X15 [Sebastes umbrosus]|uniref:interferon-induced very large GTPase 1-like isoform X15 n=1 Tax=Sebastes umbrosus TaxID=72105 RepID=UPI00189E6345|nr:interferon-induced very large GTPase 1-like isoform X15 [Sebastes umbrosus]